MYIIYLYHKDSSSGNRGQAAFTSSAAAPSFTPNTLPLRAIGQSQSQGSLQQKVVPQAAKGCLSWLSSVCILLISVVPLLFNLSILLSLFHPCFPSYASYPATNTL